MESINVRVPVVVKAKLTEKLRTRMIDEFTKMSEQMDLEIKQINLDRQRELDAHPDQSDQINRFFGNEAGMRQQRQAEALQRVEMLKKLALGAEIVQGNLERQIELKVGDNFREAMNVELLIEDDKVVAIRG